MSMLLTFEIIGSPRNHGKKYLNNVRSPLAVSSIVVGLETKLPNTGDNKVSFKQKTCIGEP